MRSIRRNDNVLVMTREGPGQDGRQVRSVLHAKSNRVIVDGVNMMKKHQRPTQAGGRARAGRHRRRARRRCTLSNVMLVCKECGKPTRTGMRRAQRRRQGARVQEVRGRH